MNRCRACGAEFDALPHQIAKGDYECVPCQREHKRAWRQQRKAEGRPVKSGRVPSSYFSEYARRPGQRLRNNARAAARRAIASGKITRSCCEVCGCLESEAHHDDYSKPLSVRWLCRAHHKEHHMNISRAAEKATGGSNAR